MIRKFLICFLAFAAMPFVFGFSYFFEMSTAYLVMWKNLLGAHYKLPIETPKPLIILLTGIFPQWCNFFLTPLLITFLVFAIVRVLRYLGVSNSGVFAGVFFAIFCNSQVLPFYFTYGFSYWPIVYLPIILWAIVFFFEGRYAVAFTLIFFAALVRPEAWIIFVAILIYRFAKGEGIKAIYFLPIFAPLIWMLVDYRIGGTFFLSDTITRHYAVVTQNFIKPTPFKTYWFWVIKILTVDFNFIVFILGCAGIFLYFRRGRHCMKEKLLLAALFFGMCVHWLACLRGEFIIQQRFLALPALFMAIYAGRFVGERILKPQVLFYFLLLGAAAFSFINWDYAPFYNGLLHKTNEKAVGELRLFLKRNQDLIKNHQAVIVPVRNGGDFSLMLGEADSHKLIFFREALADKQVKVDNSIGIYMSGETMGFSQLQDCRKTMIKLHGQAYCFDPIFIASDRRVAMYEIKRSRL